MIKSIQVSNFKSIKKATVTFGTFNVLIGANGAGKTTLISAIELTQKLAQGKTVSESTNNIAPFRRDLFNVATRAMASEIDITIAQDSENIYRFRYSISVLTKNDISELIINEELLAKLTNNGEKVLYTRHRDKISALDSKSNDGSLSDVPLAVDSGKLVLATYSDVEVTKVSALLANYKVLWLDSNFYDKDGGSDITRSDATDETLNGSVIRLFETDKALYSEAIEMIKKIIPVFREPEIIDINESLSKKSEPSSSDKSTKKIKSYIVFWNEDGLPGLFTQQALSSGNMKIIQLIFSLYNRRNYSFLIGEEIENGLHYGRIEKLIELLQFLSKKLKVQLLFTTHSPYILNSLTPTQVIYSKKNETGSTYIGLHETDEYIKIREELNAEPSGKQLFESGYFD